MRKRVGIVAVTAGLATAAFGLSFTSAAGAAPEAARRIRRA